MAHKDVFLEWKQGRAYNPSQGHASTDGVDLFSYGLRIGTRGIDGKLIALRPYGVSQQTDADMHYATLVADRTVWGIAGARTSWHEVRAFATDPALIGTEVSWKISKSWKKLTTAEGHAKKIAEADNRGSFKHGVLRCEPDGYGQYAVYFCYLIRPRDLAHSDKFDAYELAAEIDSVALPHSIVVNRPIVMA